MTRNPSRLDGSPSRELVVSAFLQVWTGEELTGSIGLIQGSWQKEQILMPVAFSDTVNTGVVWVTQQSPQDSSKGLKVLFTLFDGRGDEVDRVEHTYMPLSHYARFINEIFSGVQKGFQGTLRISVIEGVDDDPRITDEEWEERREFIRNSTSYITGAALRMDRLSEELFIFSSVPVRGGFYRYRK